MFAFQALKHQLFCTEKKEPEQEQQHRHCRQNHHLHHYYYNNEIMHNVAPNIYNGKK